MHATVKPFHYDSIPLQSPYNDENTLVLVEVSTDLSDYIWSSRPEQNFSLYNTTFDDFNQTTDVIAEDASLNYWWALLASMLVLFTAAGNVLVCCAIYLERRLQNVTNYFLMSLAITDLLVAILVMPLGILTLVQG